MNDELSNYKESGYTSPIRVMLEEEAARLVSELERIERRLGPQIFDRLQLKGHLLFPFLWDLVHDERIVERVEAIWETKPRLQVFFSNWSSVTVTISTILSLFDPIWTSNI